MFDDLDHLIHTDPFAKSTAHPSLRLKEGERREVCILFADCHGFTALSERLDHEVVHTLLDKLMQLFTARIKHFGGFIDKYEGDLVMALFGAKVASEQDTERAIEAGLQMLAVLEQFNHAVSQRLGQEVAISVRIGINTGEVTTGKVGEKREGDFTVYGDAVNLASRMESNAPLNRIMMPAATMRRVVHAFDFEPHGRIQVKGKMEPVDAWLLKGAKTERVTRWQLRSTAFVGRESEMARLQQKYERVVARLQTPSISSASSTTSTEKPVVVGLKGEAGMGKSRLVDEFLKQVEASSSYLHGTTPRLAQQAYGLFISLIRRQLGISLLDDPSSAKEKLERGFDEMELFLEDDESRSRFRESLPLIGNLLNLLFEDVRLTLPPKDLQPHLQTAIRYFIEACAARVNQSGRPLIVVLEDLQWTDPLSLAMLEFLFFTLNLEEKRRGADPKQILFLLTYRPEYCPSRGILTDSDYEEIDLSLLTPDLARALVESIAGQASPLVSEETLSLVMERSAGNPFFIEEWANYIAEHPQPVSSRTLPVPSTLQALILARMDQLEVELKLLLQKAAVFGREFFVNVVEAMEQRLEGKSDLGDNFKTLEEDQFLLSLSGRSFSAYMFKHILTQEVAYSTLLVANRKVLHRIAGEVIEELFADRLEEHFCDLAEHYEKGEVWDKAAEYLLKAADQAKERYDNGLALRLYDRALGLMKICSKTSSPMSIAKAHLGKGDVLELTGERSAAEEEYRQAVDIAYETGSSILAAVALCSRGTLARLKCEYDSALDYLQKSLIFAEEVGDKMKISTLFGNIGNVFCDRGDYDSALECYNKQMSIAEELGYERGISHVFGNMGTVYACRGEYDRAFECYQKMLSFAEEIGDKLVISKALNNMGIVFKHRREYDRALECYNKRLAIAEELGDREGISGAYGNMGNVFCHLGEYNRALECFQKHLTIAEEIGDRQGISIAVCNMGNVFADQGDLDRAIECFQKDLSIEEELGNSRGISQTLSNIGVVYMRRGDNDLALECYEKSKSIAEKLGDKRLISLAVGNCARAYYRQGNYERAREYHQVELSVALEIGDKSEIAEALGNMGMMFVCLGDLDRALEFYQESLSIAEESGDKYMISEAAGNEGTVQFDKGNYQRADELLEHAVRISRKLNLKPQLAEFLTTQAQATLALHQYARSRDLCNNALTVAQEIKDAKAILTAQVLYHKINFFAAEDNDARSAATEALVVMIDQIEDDERIADIYYELTAMHRTLNHSDQAEHHRQEAIRLYESLYAKIPKFAFKKRLDELRGPE
jgi:tetratricopeptide (TPR) repeat protein/class 3 adenylate cyclase